MTKAIKQELEAIRERNGGILHPESVVDFAKNPATALHKHFVWDDTEAAARYRLYQAQQVIRMTVEIIGGAGVTQRVYVSLSSDRTAEPGSYRFLADVLSDQQRYAQLLADALAELAAFKRKYQRLTELQPVFAAVETVAKPSRRKSRVRMAEAQPAA